MGRAGIGTTVVIDSDDDVGGSVMFKRGVEDKESPLLATMVTSPLNTLSEADIAIQSVWLAKASLLVAFR